MAPVSYVNVWARKAARTSEDNAELVKAKAELLIYKQDLEAAKKQNQEKDVKIALLSAKVETLKSLGI